MALDTCSPLTWCSSSCRQRRTATSGGVVTRSATPSRRQRSARVSAVVDDLVTRLDPCRMAEKITVLLVDDHALVRRGFRRILEDDARIKVVGEAGDGREAIQLARELKPKVVLMDLAMPGMNGLDATRKILTTSPESSVLMLSMHSE